jgi:TrmH family RNA methyltransferase
MTGLAFDNPKVQRLRRLLGRRRSRQQERRFVIEGPVLVAEAVAAGWRLEQQVLPEGSDAAIEGAGEVCRLADGVFERVAPTLAPRPPLAIAAMDDGGRRSAPTLADAGFVLVLDRIADPGNLGTILRSAEAAGVELVVLTPGSADPYAPKVVRASAGALFHVPLASADLAELRAAGLRVIGTTSHATPSGGVRDHDAADWSGRIAVVMGPEAAGLTVAPSDVDGPVDEWVTISHVGRSESLNVAMAATVLVFAAARRRRSWKD